MSEPSLAGRTVAELLDALASTEPAPGAGAAGAVVLALGVACARKALRLSARHHPGNGSLPRLDEKLASAATRALALGRDDAAGFRAFIETHDEEREIAAEQLDRTGTRLVSLCDEAAALVGRAAPHVDAPLAKDIDAARALIATARAIHAGNRADA